MPYNDITLLDRLRSDSSGTPIAAMVDQFKENVFVSNDGTNFYKPETNSIYINANSSSPLADFIHEYAHALTNAEHLAKLEEVAKGTDLEQVQLAVAAEIRSNEAKAEGYTIFQLGQAGFLNTLGLGSGYISISQAIQLYNDCKAQSGFVPNTAIGASAMLACLVTGVKAVMPAGSERTSEYASVINAWKLAHNMPGSATSPAAPGGGGHDSSGLPPPIPSPAPTNPLPPVPPIKEVNITDPTPVPPPPPPSGGGGGGGPKPGDEGMEVMGGNGESSQEGPDPAQANEMWPTMFAPPHSIWVDAEADQLVSAMAAFAPPRSQFAVQCCGRTSHAIAIVSVKRLASNGRMNSDRCGKP